MHCYGRNRYLWGISTSDVRIPPHRTHELFIMRCANLRRRCDICPQPGGSPWLIYAIQFGYSTSPDIRDHRLKGTNVDGLRNWLENRKHQAITPVLLGKPTFLLHKRNECALCQKQEKRLNCIINKKTIYPNVDLHYPTGVETITLFGLDEALAFVILRRDTCMNNRVSLRLANGSNEKKWYVCAKE